MIGQTISHYKITDKLGSGGMGDVYRARDTKLGRDVAIKFLPEEMARDAERRRRFEREARAVAALKHPNIVTIYSVEEAAGRHFITMELVEGQSLRDVIPRGGLSLERLFDLAIPLADAISSAHESSITHRDLKPANIMLDHSGRLKVLDFGLAKLLDPTADAERAKTVVGSVSDTAVGQILGTAAYMSPEQAEGKPIDHRSDIFSLGIVLYEMATGERPFKGDTHISTISSVLKDNPPSVTSLKHSLPHHLGRIVNRCLEKKPDKRFQSAKDIHNELEGLKKEVDSGELTETVGAAPAAARSRSWLPFAIVGGVIVIVAGMWMVRSPMQDDGNKTQPTQVAASSAPGSARAGGDNRKMTIVFPFENLGPPEDAYFAAGMTEEITSRLAAVSGLGVISRTSATQYDRTGKTMKQIGEDLGVDYVLEGTVRWAKRADGSGRVRITPQLIRVSDDTHLWSDTYDRELDDIFDVQSDIAGRVIEQLDVTLLGSERVLVETALTKNMKAYKLYMQAKDLEPEGDFAEYDMRRVKLFEKAIELDPGFIAARSELSIHHSSHYTIFDHTDGRLSRARKALQAAETIDPDHHRTRLARGYYLYYGFRDYDQALTEFLAALAAVPSDAEAQQAIGYIYRRQGKWDQSNAALEKALDLDPRDEDIASNLATTYRGMRRFEDAVRAIERAIDVDPDDDQNRWAKARYMVAWKGDVDAARELAPPKSTRGGFWQALSWFSIHMWERNYSAAIEAVQEMKETSPLFQALQSHLIAVAEALAEDPRAARRSLEASARELETVLDGAPSNSVIRQWLSVTYAILDRKDAAVREAKLAVDLTAKDNFAGPESLENLAAVYAIIGRHEEAIDLLERLMNTVYSGSITPNLLKLNAAWDPLRKNPRFQKLLQENI
ncbi:MAG: protein kinase [Candidatus Krumholzibacteria bacterium]